MREENCGATVAMLERCLDHDPFFQVIAFSGPGAYLIRLLSRPGRCRRIEERVNQEIPACGFRDLSESAGQKMGKGLGTPKFHAKRTFDVAQEVEFGQTASLKRLNTGRNCRVWQGRIPVASSVDRFAGRGCP
jgi:hypothetical protein